VDLAYFKVPPRLILATGAAVGAGALVAAAAAGWVAAGAAGAVVAAAAGLAAVGAGAAVGAAQAAIRNEAITRRDRTYPSFS
jgi:type IV secretory pathway TrbL component